MYEEAFFCDYECVDLEVAGVCCKQCKKAPLQYLRFFGACFYQALSRLVCSTLAPEVHLPIYCSFGCYSSTLVEKERVKFDEPLLDTLIAYLIYLALMNYHLNIFCN